MDENVRYVFDLFVANHAAHTRELTASLAHAMEGLAPGRVEINTINVLEQPERAEASKVFATPMLIRISPEPVVRILGDFSNTARVLELFGLSPV